MVMGVWQKLGPSAVTRSKIPARSVVADIVASPVRCWMNGQRRNSAETDGEPGGRGRRSRRDACAGKTAEPLMNIAPGAYQTLIARECTLPTWTLEPGWTKETDPDVTSCHANVFHRSHRFIGEPVVTAAKDCQRERAVDAVSREFSFMHGESMIPLFF